MSDGETLIYTRPSYRKAVGTPHCALEHGSDLDVNERQKTGHYHAQLGLLKKECQMVIFFYLTWCT